MTRFIPPTTPRQAIKVETDEDYGSSSDVTIARLRAQKPIISSSGADEGKMVMPLTSLLESIGIRGQGEDAEENEEEEESTLSSESKSLTAALARTLGRLEQLDLAKELYMTMLARDHPFPFCAWQVRGTQHLFCSTFESSFLSLIE